MSEVNTGQPETAVASLLGVVREQCERHRVLGGLIERKREAIRRADIDAITRLCQEENDLAQALAEAEKRRLRLVGDLTARLSPQAEQPLTLHEIADGIGGREGRDLVTLGAALREEIRTVRGASAVVAAAARALIRHMGGLMQSVNGALSRVRVYERRGRIDPGTQVNFCVDVTS